MDSRTSLTAGKNGSAALTAENSPVSEPISVEKHFSPAFYAELWGLSYSTILRWFQDKPGVLKMGSGSGQGRRTRAELRIPFSVAMKEYAERSR